MAKKTAAAPAPELVKVEDLIPYARNPRTHEPAQVARLAAAMEEWGFVGAIVVRDGVIAKGHGTLAAVQKLYAAGKLLYPAPGKSDPETRPFPEGMVPVLRVDGWSDAQFRAYVIADNRLALDAGWDVEVLGLELEDLRASSFDLELVGFNDAELDGMFGPPAGEEERYTQKIRAPLYEPKGEKPAVTDLCDSRKTDELVHAIQEAKGISAQERKFLLHAAQRHRVFDFQAIAEFYCHASPELQALMEASALVLIDFDKAVEGGFVRMSERLDGIYDESYGEDDAQAA